MRHLQATCAAALLAATTATTAVSAGAAATITDERQVLRSALTATYLYAAALGENLSVNAEGPRDIADRALRALNEQTTVAQLAAAPDGLSFPCPVSGALTARITPGLLRVLKVAWQECLLEDDFNFFSSIDGPAELTLLGNSLAPERVASIRLGNRERDLNRTVISRRSRLSGGNFERWNLRMTGIIPMARPFASGTFPGRYLFEMTGYHELEQLGRDFPDPGPPFYSRKWRMGAEGALVTGESKDEDGVFQFEHRILTGTFTERLDSVARPNRPFELHNSGTYRAHDLRIRSGTDVNLNTTFFEIDGRVDVDLGEMLGTPGCTSSETFVYRTRVPLSSPLDYSFAPLFDGGELSINGSATARFSLTGPDPEGLVTMHVGLEGPRFGSSGFDTMSSMYDLNVSAGCTAP